MLYMQILTRPFYIIHCKVILVSPDKFKYIILNINTQTVNSIFTRNTKYTIIFKYKIKDQRIQVRFPAGEKHFFIFQYVRAGA